MTENSTAISRKSFLKLMTGAVAGAALLNIPKSTYAQLPNMKRTAVNKLPDAIEAAKGSELIQISYNKIREYVNTIRDSKLRGMTMDIIERPLPTFMQQYRSESAKQSLYNKLVSMKLIDTAKTPFEKFLPPFNGKVPQPFFSAPGSGYASHHAYPGGLATHTAANLCISEGIYDTYRKMYNSNLSYDTLISAQALHDLAKPFVFQWQKDQSSLKEYTIAGTGAHHIFSIAEVIYRGFPKEEIVAQACAHATPGGKADEALVAGWIRAAAIIAGKNAKALGLVESDTTIPAPHKQEGYIVSLGDHDYVLSGPACQKSVVVLKQIAKEKYGYSSAQMNGSDFNRFRNYIFAQASALKIDSLNSTENGAKAVQDLVQDIIIK